MVPGLAVDGSQPSAKPATGSKSAAGCSANGIADTTYDHRSTASLTTSRRRRTAASMRCESLALIAASISHARLGVAGAGTLGNSPHRNQRLAEHQNRIESNLSLAVSPTSEARVGPKRLKCSHGMCFESSKCVKNACSGRELRFGAC